MSGEEASTTLTIPSDPKYLCVVRDVSDRMTALQGMRKKESEEVKHAVDEACSNAMKHACRGDRKQKIVITFTLNPRRFQVTIDDTGIKTKPEHLRGRDLADVRPGGLGVHLIRRAFDVVEIDEKKKKGNRLRLIKYRDGGR